MSHKSLEERASRIAIVSSGEPEKDQRELLQAAQHQARMEENICPNGCGPMEWDDPNTRHCPICSFVGWCNAPYGYTGATRA
jgi:rubrerythrin